jgi:multicomponent Na+:H+ antiporter subunit D
MLISNLIIMQIIFPLLGGLISFLLPKKWSWLFANIVMGFTLAISVLLLKASFTGEEFSYNLGGWSSSIGIEYKLHKLGSLFLFLVSFISLLNLFGMRSLISYELVEEKYPLFFGLLLISIASLLGICISNDIFNIYVMLEVSAISSYALVASAKNPNSSKAAFDYLIFGTIGSTFILFGIGFIYALIGSLNLTEISYAMPAAIENNAIKAGIALIFFGVLMKAALFPVSSGLVNIYQGAPSFISSILASTSNKIGIYLVINFFFYIFYLNKTKFEYIEISLSLVAIFSILICGILALRQDNIKRFLGYSSLSQIGFIFFGLAIGSKLAFSGVLIYCFTHALEKTALFLAAGYLIAATSSEDVNTYSGIAKKNPWISSIIMINLLSSVGFPLTAGFIGKWQIFKASLATDIWFMLVIMLSALFTFVYAFRFAEILLFKKSHEHEVFILVPMLDKTCLWVISGITILNLYLGINNQYLLSIW